MEDYKTPADLGNILLEDLKKAIDRDFPIVTSTYPKYNNILSKCNIFDFRKVEYSTQTKIRT